MQFNNDPNVAAFRNTFSRTAKAAISDKSYILEYCISKRAWKDAVIRERFNANSPIKKNKTAIISFIINELTNNSDAICKDFNEWHNNICKSADYGMRYGVWQKLINMAFKYLYCVKDLFPEYENVWSQCHCPIDSVIAGQLYKQLKLLGLPEDELELSRKIYLSNKITWNYISEIDYKKFQNQVLTICKQQNITPLQFDFKYWNK